MEKRHHNKLLDQADDAIRLKHIAPSRPRTTDPDAALALAHILPRTHPISTRALMKAIRHWAKQLGSGFLAIDDVVVAKPFCWMNPWVGWTYCTSERRKVRGFHVVVLLWCTGCWRMPVAFRLWRPKKNCHPKRYRKKAELAWEMIVEVLPDGLEIEYVVGDTFYTASWLTKKINRLGLKWVGVLHPKAIVYYQERRWSVTSLGEWLTLKWRARLGLRARSIVAYLPKLWHLEIGRDQKPSGEYRGACHRRLGQRFDHPCMNGKPTF